jgi:hypothetical protein
MGVLELGPQLALNKPLDDAENYRSQIIEATGLPKFAGRIVGRG